MNVDTLPANFVGKVHPSPGCILWTGAVNNKGYGCVAVGGKSQLAHRIAWEHVHGPIPSGMTIDHLCRVRNCVRIDHLELVSLAENIRRAKRALTVGGECRHGHQIADEFDLYMHPRTGVAECRQCIRERARARRATERETTS